MIEQTNEMNALLDTYEQLLTEKQREVMTLYFKEDFSLAEISEALHVSRAAVNDHIKRSEKILLGYEEKLHLVKNYAARSDIYDKIKAAGDNHIRLMVEQLENIE